MAAVQEEPSDNVSSASSESDYESLEEKNEGTSPKSNSVVEVAEKNATDSSITTDNTTGAVRDKNLQLSEAAPFSISRRRSIQSLDKEKLLQSVVHKKLIFFPIKDWEEDRLAKYHTFLINAEPLYTRIIDVAQNGKTILRQSIDALRQFSKVLGLMSHGLKSIADVERIDKKGSETENSYTSKDNASFEHSTASQVEKDDKDNQKNETELHLSTKQIPIENSASNFASAQSGTTSSDECSFIIDTPDFQQFQHILNIFSEISANTSDGSALILNKILSDILEPLSVSYNAKITIVTDTLKKERSAMFAGADRCRQDWLEYEAIFKESEINEVHQGTNRRCCWLFERKYRHSADTIFQLQRNFFKEIISAALKMSIHEDWRSKQLKACYDMLIATIHSGTLKLITSLDDGLRLYGDDAFVNGRSRNTSGYRSGQVGLVYRNSSNEGYSIDNKNISYKYLANEVYNSAGSGLMSEVLSDPSQRQHGDSVPVNTPQTALLLKILDDIGLEEPNEAQLFTRNSNVMICLEQLDSFDPPESSLVIKIGEAQKATGIKPFQKWNTIKLVLTWDRFLHIFKDLQDPSPIHSFNLSAVELRLFPLKNKATPAYVELRDILWGVIPNIRPTVLRISSEQEADHWLSRLKVAGNVAEFVSASSEQLLHDVVGGEDAAGLNYFPTTVQTNFDAGIRLDNAVDAEVYSNSEKRDDISADAYLDIANVSDALKEDVELNASTDEQQAGKSIPLLMKSKINPFVDDEN